MKTKAYTLALPLLLLSAALPPAAARASDSQPPADSAASSEPSGSTDASQEASVRRLISELAGETGVPAELADAVVRIESRYVPHARNGRYLGLMQISLPTARSQGYSGGVAGLLDARTNLRFGLRYLAGAYRLAGGDVCGTVLRYQAGHGATAMTGAARRYCAKVRTFTLASSLY